MEHTFMTIHNLTPDCNILFASDSITDILGWRPEEVHGRSVFSYFHPDEVPFARSIHSRGILLDKAASLHYARLVTRDGQWASCECCFTVVHDVLVACTSIYRRDQKSERRAIEGAQIRRIFSSSPRDPRYHMLEHLSPKFKMPPVEREPRAALILNRFTRNLSIMFSTNAVASVLGLTPDQVKDKSFYRCIQERCLPDAVKCLEGAKANDSIAYLRFWSRDPREAEDFEDGNDEADGEDHPMDDEDRHSSTSDSEGGGAELDSHMALDEDDTTVRGGIKQEEEDESMDSVPSASSSSVHEPAGNAASSSRSGNPQQGLSSQRASAGNAVQRRRPGRRQQRRRGPQQPLPAVELEAVVSCTSDGLVVVLRRARPAIPPAHPPLALPWDFENGLFAAPWAPQPVRPFVPPEMLYTFRPPLMPQYMPLQDHVRAAGGPPNDQLMHSIREVGVFAWGLCGINGNLHAFSHGNPMDEAVPPDGLPVWDPSATGSPYQPPENQAAAKWAAMVAQQSPFGSSVSSGTHRQRELQQQMHSPMYYSFASASGTQSRSSEPHVPSSGPSAGHTQASSQPGTPHDLS
ncbi:hypothetical protein J7T55_014431 [Diaporthe amygdali]|uniref:uncharacterized protein n=1 Tax=Phomopsis amygdali TaxID=1214568 RepID=UPI0022FEC0BB|nr:uncharacterized protein J7T55_014431 [Diaporthe amygdali]KAJ0117980.1 hypothetical protein J7T55_014431 [Diaporthe amygdali]